MAPKSKYTIKEKVLCYHGPLLYEAKCIQIEIQGKQLKYYVHYNGWNKNWDEWVGEARILKYCDVNIQKQAELYAEYVTSKKSKSRGTKKDRVVIKKERDIVIKQEKDPDFGEVTYPEVTPGIKKGKYSVNQGKPVEIKQEFPVYIKQEIIEEDEETVQQEKPVKRERTPVAKRERKPAAKRERTSVVKRERTPVAKKGKSPITKKEKNPVAKKEKNPVSKRDRNSTAKRERNPVTKRERSPVTKRERNPVTKRERNPVAKRERCPTPKKAKDPVVKKGKSPVVKKGRGSLVKEKGPVKKGKSPAVKRKSPVKKCPIVKKEKDPVVKKKGPVIKEKSPIIKKEASAKQKTSSPKKPTKSKAVTRTSIAKTATKQRIAVQKAKAKPAIQVQVQISPEIPRIKLEITIPQDLNHHLIDDEFLINSRKKLLHLPARITVNHVVREYIRIRDGMPYDRRLGYVHMTCRYISTYFNIALGKKLLYKFERMQYSDIIQNVQSHERSDVYGAIHLLRMLSNIGEYVSEDSPNLSNKQVSVFQYCIQDFINLTADFFKRNLDLQDYEVASPEYIRRTMLFSEIM